MGEWVKCSERMPPSSFDLIWACWPATVYRKRAFPPTVSITRYSNGKWDSLMVGCEIDPPTHWMPAEMPPPPA